MGALILSRVQRSLRERGLAATIVRAVEAAFGRLLALLVAPLVRLADVRFIQVRADRIGHLVVEPDCYLKERALAGAAGRGMDIVCLPSDQLANRHLAKYWKAHLRVVTSPLACRLLWPLAHRPGVGVDVSRYVALVDTTAGYGAIQRRWGERGPLLRLSDEDSQRGFAALHALGLPRDAWFACLHVREAGYSPEDDALHAYRNCDIGRFLPALQQIRARGGRIVRLGDPSMQRLPAMEGVIDYAHSGSRSDWMDVFLCGAARLFVGTSSGLCNVASVFGRPSCLANLTPLSTVLPYGAGDVGIPKLLYSVREDRYLSFGEAFGSPVSNYRFSDLYEKAGVRVEENSSEDIAALIGEALDRLEGKAAYTAQDETRQARFKALMRPGHYSLGAPSRVGRDFLRTYERFL